jgi:hypothetical protein
LEKLAMKSLRKVLGDLMGRVKSTPDRKRRPGRAALGSLFDQLETRAMLSQVNLAPPIFVPPPSEVGTAVIVSPKAPIFSVDASAPDDSGALDVIESNGQIGVQLVDLDVIESNGQIGVQLTDR